jgi:hypothetical protein
MEKIIIYCSMEKTQGKPLINYFIVTGDPGGFDDANVLFEMAS